jgi:hypothetical protein
MTKYGRGIMLAITLVVGSGAYAETFDKEVYTYFINGVDNTHKKAGQSSDLLRLMHGNFANSESLYNWSKSLGKDLFEATVLTANIHDMYSRLLHSGGLDEKKIKRDAKKDLDKVERRIIYFTLTDFLNDPDLSIRINELDLFRNIDQNADSLLRKGFGFVKTDLASLKGKTMKKLFEAREKHKQRLKVLGVALDVDRNIDEMFYIIHPKEKSFQRKKVNLITHSEGGPIGNILAQRLSMLGDKVKILAIASPVEKVFVDSELRQVGKGQLALKEDLAYQLFPNSNPANMTNYSSEEENILDSVILTGLKNVTKYGDESGHGFDIYMKVGSDSYNNIKILALANHKILSEYDFLKGDKKRLQRQVSKDVSKCNDTSDVKIMESNKWHRVSRMRKDKSGRYTVYVQKPRKSQCESGRPISKVEFVDDDTGCFKKRKAVYSPWFLSSFTEQLCKEGIFKD